jgi:hypothetical protein
MEYFTTLTCFIRSSFEDRDIISDFLGNQILFHLFEKTLARLPSRRSLKMQAVFCYHEIIVAKVRTKASPESIYHLRVESMPEVGVQFLSPIEEVEDIIEPIGFVYLHTCIMCNFDEHGTSRGIFEDDCFMFLSFRMK